MSCSIYKNPLADFFAPSALANATITIRASAHPKRSVFGVSQIVFLYPGFPGYRFYLSILLSLTPSSLQGSRSHNNNSHPESLSHTL